MASAHALNRLLHHNFSVPHSSHPSYLLPSAIRESRYRLRQPPTALTTPQSSDSLTQDVRIESATVSSPISSQLSPNCPRPKPPRRQVAQQRLPFLFPLSKPLPPCQIPVFSCLQELKVLKEYVVAVVGIFISSSSLFPSPPRALPSFPASRVTLSGTMSQSPHTPGSASSFVYNSAGQNLAHHLDSRNPMSSSQISWLAGLSTSFDAPTDEQKYLRKVSARHGGRAPAPGSKASRGANLRVLDVDHWYHRTQGQQRPDPRRSC